MPPRARGRGTSNQPRKGKSVRVGDTLQTVFEVNNVPTPNSATTESVTPVLPTTDAAPQLRPQASSSQQQTTQAPERDSFLSRQNPIGNEDDDPFISNHPSHSNLNVPTGSPEIETINIAISPTSSDSDNEEPLPVLPRQPLSENRPLPQQRHLNRRSSSPRSGPHSRPSSSSSTVPSNTTTTQKSKTSGPAGNRTHHEAQDVWMFFQEEKNIQPGNKKSTRHCLLCEKMKSVTPTLKVKAYSSTTSTSTLRKHLADHHLEEWVDSCDERKIQISETLNIYSHVQQHRSDRDGRQNTQPNNPNNGTERFEFSNEAFVDAICDFVVSDDQSINVIENPQLRAIFLMLRSELQDKDIPRRTILRERILERLREHLETLANDMQSSIGKISFTMDMWSDTNLSPFMGVTAHWIQAIPTSTPYHTGVHYKLKMRTDLIGFQRVPGRHTGDHLSVAFLAVLDRLGIASKIGWITMDNATNNDKFCAVLERELYMRQIPFNKIRNRVRCFPHIVNLACKAALSAITSTQHAQDNAPDFEPPDDDGQYITDVLEALSRDPVASVRSAVRNIRSSSLRRQQFSDIIKTIQGQVELQLIKDVDTRWSSTLLMINRALELKKPMVKFLAENPDLAKYQLSEMEWEALKVVKEILMVPHAFQQLLSHEKVPTLGYTIPAFQLMILAWKNLQEQRPNVSHIIQAGLDKLEGYQDRLDLVPANIFATVLHPEYKLRFFQKKMPQTVQNVKRTFIEAARPYYTQETPASGATPMNDSSWASQLLGFDSPVKNRRGRSLEEEIEGYFLDTSSSGNPVQFWEDNQHRWPTLFRFALDILPIQGSAVPCERIFSSAKETTTARRNRIKPLLMEALQILKFAIKNGHSLNFTEGMSLKDELLEMEREGADSAHTPENLAAYRTELQQLQQLLEEDEDEVGVEQSET